MNSSNHKVLALKYRPKNFQELIGQDIMVQTITNSIKLNKLPNAYLLTGIRGLGKTTTARLIAKALNCTKNFLKEENCNCNHCEEIANSKHLDVLEMDAASRTGIDDVRELIESSKYNPTSAKYKIFIIDEVHMLSKQAFNGLLKTLEEPPPHLKFIFATTEVKKIPVTIISRCQRFDLHRVNAEVLTPHLNSIAKNENIKISNDAMALIVRSADGSVRDGLSLLDQAIANESDDITIKTISLMLGLADRGKIFDLLDAIFNADSSLSLDIYNELYESGADILAIFDEMLKVTHFLTQLLISPKIKDDIYIPELERTRGTEMTQKLKLSSLGRFWQVLFKGYQELQYGSHLFQLGEMIIIRLIFIHEGPSPGDLVKKIEKEINKIEKTQAVTSENYEKKSTEVVNIEKNLSNKNKDESLNILPINSFREFVDLFYQKREGILHAHLYNSTKLISFKEGEVVINAEKILDHNFSRTIARNISKWTGRIWNISTSSSNIGKTLQEEDIMMKQKEIELMKKDPEVQKILNKYQGVSIHSITKIGLTSDEKIKDKKQDKKLKR